jgi:hypothetical protein
MIAEKVYLGFGMQGLGNAVAELITDVLREKFNEITYLEIGVGHGATLGGLARVMRDSFPPRAWRAIGVELPNGYSFDKGETFRHANINHIAVTFTENEAQPPMWGRVTVYLRDSQTFVPDFPIHMALIDACHCSECPKREFLNIESDIVEGGYVLFHDFGLDQIDQAQSPQAKHPINGVRVACAELNLLDETRPGWEFVGELVGDKKAGSANMGVFKKV